jgi:hypothetical protein
VIAVRHLLWIFVAACASAPAPAPTPAPAPPPPAEQVAVPNRPLTAGEIALLRPLFRDGIDYDRVRVIDNAFPLQPENVDMTPRGHIYAPGGLWQPDFSTVRASLRQVFVHEMTHVWQYANGMDLVAQSLVDFTRFGGQYEKAYAYELAPDRDLVDYGMEQQASIIADYFAITVDHDPPRELQSSLTDAERDALYAKVIKNFLGDARYARALDPKAVADQHARSKPAQSHGAPSGDARMCDWRFTPLPKR